MAKKSLVGNNIHTILLVPHLNGSSLADILVVYIPYISSYNIMGIVLT